LLEELPRGTTTTFSAALQTENIPGIQKSPARARERIFVVMVWFLLFSRSLRVAVLPGRGGVCVSMEPVDLRQCPVNRLNMELNTRIIAYAGSFEKTPSKIERAVFSVFAGVEVIYSIIS
jgi:hypothetical protein